MSNNCSSSLGPKGISLHPGIEHRNIHWMNNSINKNQLKPKKGISIDPCDSKVPDHLASDMAVSSHSNDATSAWWSLSWAFSVWLDSFSTRALPWQLSITSVATPRERKHLFPNSSCKSPRIHSAWTNLGPCTLICSWIKETKGTWQLHAMHHPGLDVDQKRTLVGKWQNLSRISTLDYSVVSTVIS